MKQEPTTDAELEAALKTSKHELIDHGEFFTVKSTKTGASTRLEADDLSNALLEAWNLVKP